MMCDVAVTLVCHPNAKRAMSHVSSRIAVQTLGTVAIDIGERRIGPSSGRLFALVLYLALRRGHQIPRRVAQELLFSAVPDGRAAHSLRQLVYRLRQIGAPIEGDDDQLWVPLERVSVDWWQIVADESAAKVDLECLAYRNLPGLQPRNIRTVS